MSGEKTRTMATMVVRIAPAPVQKTHPLLSTKTPMGMLTIISAIREIITRRVIADSLTPVRKNACLIVEDMGAKASQTG